ncbi:MAG: ABC transporter ATP-binding protein [Clostridia bacterium]|nr:ABC transporter ATP-binding protein [Clostridia bacterium]
MEKVLEVKNLTKKYRNSRGIESISFDIYKGDVFGFLGPNGAGKTTTMKIITGLCRADAGEVKVFGHNISTDYEKAMRKVGCIIETAEAYDYISGYKNLVIASRFYKEVKKSRIDEVLDLVGLSSVKNEKVSNYSLGMKQRLGLASAILSNPELVILDEPVNGLDIEGMVDIRNIIKNLAEEHGITFFISSHLIHEMEMVCNRVGIIEKGKLIKTGEVKELLNNHSTLEDFFIEQVKGQRRLN